MPEMQKRLKILLTHYKTNNMLNQKIKNKIQQKTAGDPKLQRELLYIVDQTSDGKSFNNLISEIMNNIK